MTNPHPRGPISQYTAVLQGETVTAVARRLFLSRPALYKALKEGRYADGKVIMAKLGRPVKR